jgi:hypothetical protein
MRQQKSLLEFTYGRPRTLVLSACALLFTWVVPLAPTPASAAEADPRVAHYKEKIEPVLLQYCFDCHGDGEKKGGIAFDEFKSTDELLKNPELWRKVLNNVRAGIMPPPKKDQPPPEEKQALANFIKYDVFGINPADPDPGRVTLRRLNRVEYRNTVRDLMNVDFRADEEFPPDDTGYGFDNIGDVLAVSPLLLEKYMQAAETVVSQGVPTTSRAVREVVLPGRKFQRDEDGDGRPDADQPRYDDNDENPKGGRGDGRQLTFYKPAKLAYVHKADTPGTYHLVVELNVRGDFDFDPGRCNFSFKVDDRELLKQEFGWQNGKTIKFEYDEKWEPGEKRMAFALEPLTPPEQKKTSVDMRVVSVTVRGPTEPEKWDRPKNFDRFFTKDAPADAAARREYARDVLTKFATKAFRRPVDAKTVDRLVAIAEEGYNAPDKTFEHGVAQAMVAVLASPRFLFRVEDLQPGTPESQQPFVDEYALASRLSYFLWSTMPDEELTELARKGELRKNLPAQLKRMLASDRSEQLVQNFVGQWLQVRDVDGISIDARTVLARDKGEDKEMAKQQEERKAQFARIEALPEAERQKEFEKLRAQFRNRGRFRPPAVELDEPLRRAMRRESEMYFQYVFREDRSVLEMLDSDYTFVNERLAKLYGIPDVKGQEMRKVTLPPDSVRGGMLTQGSVLVVTSNPTRTSPVKRGLFVLDNFLGSPTPPPPPDVPVLEASEKEFKDKDPSLREVLELHRGKPLCSSCHNRMDPLGLALENFNALGMFRETERKLPIDTKGKLITGETFEGIRDLKKILREKRKTDFYRCLTEKMMTYALGRGLEDYDTEAVDRIVEKLEKEDGKFSALLSGIVDSTPFQKRRRSNPPTPNTSQQVEATQSTVVP